MTDLENLLVLKTFTKNIPKACKIIIDHKLYHDKNWMLYKWCHPSSGYIKPKKVVIAYLGNEPIAVGIVRTNNLCAFYVKPKYRRNGIGKRIARRLKYKNPDPHAWIGIPKSREFFKSVKIKA